MCAGSASPPGTRADCCIPATPTPRYDAPRVRAPGGAVAKPPRDLGETRYRMSPTAVICSNSWSASRRCSLGRSVNAYRMARLRRSSVLRRSAPPRRSTRLRKSSETAAKAERLEVARWSAPARRSAITRRAGFLDRLEMKSPRGASSVQCRLVQASDPNGVAATQESVLDQEKDRQHTPTPPRAAIEPVQGECHPSDTTRRPRRTTRHLGAPRPRPDIRSDVVSTLAAPAAHVRQPGSSGRPGQSWAVLGLNPPFVLT